MESILYKTTLFLVCMVSAVIASPYVYTPPQYYDDTIFPGWQNKKADVYFVLDTSASIWIKHFRNMSMFVSHLVEHMDIGPDKTRVGLGTYSEEFHPYIPIDNDHSKAALVGMIQETPYEPLNGFLSVAVQGLRQKGLPREMRRPGVPAIAVIFTDGVSRYKQFALDNATLAKEEDIFLFTVGVGVNVYKAELYEMASDPKPAYYHYVPSFADLPGLREKLMANMAEVEYFHGDEGSCGSKVKVDIVFVYDDYSLGRKMSLEMSQFLENTADRLSMGSGNVRLAAVASSERQRDFMLGDYVRREKLKARLDYQQNEESPLADLVVRTMTDAFLSTNGARPGAIRRMVVVLDRLFTMEDRLLLLAVLRAKYDGIQVYVIQLGSSYNKEFAAMIASKPSWVFVDTPLSDLLKPKSEFFSRFCEDL